MAAAGRLPGARVKHWMKTNWIKMYDKHGCVLRVETVINDPYEFKVRRRAGRRGHRTLGWHPLPKGVACLPRYATGSAAAKRAPSRALRNAVRRGQRTAGGGGTLPRAAARSAVTGALG
ncbi:MAG TPA: hypothetical protein VJ829_07545, partial [Candidatus Binatia bacterium]|nr:hypothetical protein [Candidatus Binatia bacterium]